MIRWGRARSKSKMDDQDTPVVHNDLFFFFPSHAQTTTGHAIRQVALNANNRPSHVVVELV
jgi:hypothetical protein